MSCADFFKLGDKQMLQESVIRNVVSSTMNHFRGYNICSATFNYYGHAY